MITDTQKTKINEIISATNGMISRIEKGVVKGQEVEDFFAEQIRIIKGFFNNMSDEWRIIDRWENENGFQWYSTYKPGIYAGEKEKQKLQKLITILNTIFGDENLNNKKEWQFNTGEVYEAKRFICSLFRTIGSKLIVIDEHLDDQFFEYIDIVPDTAQIQIITGDQKPIFWTLLAELKKKKQNIEARVNNISHCRYIVVDDSIIYSTDASLNTLGKKDFMIHKLEDNDEINKIKKEIEGYWNNAKLK